MSRYQIVFVSLVVVFSILLVAVVFGFGIYQLGWDGEISKMMSLFIPFPAAWVNGRSVSVSSLLMIAQTRDRLLERGLTLKSSATRADLLDSLIELEILKQISKENQVSVTDKELQEYSAYVLSQINISEEGQKRALESTLGMSLRQFQRYVVYPDLLRKKTQVKLFDSKKSGYENYRAAGRVLLEVQSGESSFEEIARRESEDDATNYQGGDMGFVEGSKIDLWLRSAALAMRVGEISDVLITPDGFVIFQLAARSEDGGKIKLQLKKILIRAEPDIDDIIARQMARARIYKLKKM